MFGKTDLSRLESLCLVRRLDIFFGQIGRCLDATYGRWRDNILREVKASFINKSYTDPTAFGTGSLDSLELLTWPCILATLGTVMGSDI